jgi:hypothetical protein
MWHYRGVPHYLAVQARRLGVTETICDRARHNKEIYRIGILLVQLAERWHKARRPGDERPFFPGPELAQIKGTLGEAEKEVKKLHLLAAGAAAMLAEAHEAFELLAEPRGFEVLCEHDPKPEGNGAPSSGKPAVSKRKGVI